MSLKENNITRILHWGFASFVLVMLTIGLYMTKTEYSLKIYEWHKSLGVIFSTLIGIRLYWQIKHPWPLSHLGNKYESLARKAVHTLLMALLLAIPVMGLLSSAYSGWSVHLFDIVIVPQNINVAGQVEPFNVEIYETAKLLHKVLAYLLIVLILSHVGAVLKHHLIDKDGTLVNMLNPRQHTKES